jgi:hypothetical protein
MTFAKEIGLARRAIKHLKENGITVHEAGYTINGEPPPDVKEYVDSMIAFVFTVSQLPKPDGYSAAQESIDDAVEGYEISQVYEYLTEQMGGLLKGSRTQYSGGAIVACQ